MIEYRVKQTLPPEYIFKYRYEMIKSGRITRVVSKLSRLGNVSVTDQILRLCYHHLHPPEMIHYISSFHYSG